MKYTNFAKTVFFIDSSYIAFTLSPNFRFFAPAAGINEDLVTGSAHYALAPYWSQLLGREALAGYQALERGGTAYTRLAGDRVILAGHAVTVFRGELA